MSKSKRNRPRVADLIRGGIAPTQDEELIDDLELEDVEDEDIVLGAESSDEVKDDEGVGETEDGETEDEDELDVVVDDAPAMQEAGESTVGGIFLNKIFRHDNQLAHRVIADMMLTDLSTVTDRLREWYTSQPPEVFSSYDSAKGATYQFLVNSYEQFAFDEDFAHAIAHWFTHTLGLRRRR